jgi:hypothetical protein
MIFFYQFTHAHSTSNVLLLVQFFLPQIKKKRSWHTLSPRCGALNKVSKKMRISWPDRSGLHGPSTGREIISVHPRPQAIPVSLSVGRLDWEEAKAAVAAGMEKKATLCYITQTPEADQLRLSSSHMTLIEGGG